MNLSVESRVKAHISTSYIDADGRGCERVFATDYADCMKSPAEFQRIQNGQGEDDALVKQLEEHCANLVERSKIFRKAMDEREASRKKALATEAASSGVAVSAQRALQIELDRDADSAKMDAAYHRRLESDLDMDRYLRLLVKSDEAKVRDQEEGVTSRHAQLKARAEAAKKFQRDALESEKRSTEHLEGLEARLVLQFAQQEEARRAQQLIDDQRKELDAMKTQRARDAELQLERTKIRVAQEIESRHWEDVKRKALASASHAALVVTQHDEALTTLVVSQEGAKEEALYQEMRRLQSEYEQRALELQQHIKSKYQVGSYLEHLMTAARATAERDKEMFHGLQLLQSATMHPSSLTSSATPAYSGPTTRTIAVLTTVSEPIRPLKKGGK